MQHKKFTYITTKKHKLSVIYTANLQVHTVSYYLGACEPKIFPFIKTKKHNSSVIYTCTANHQVHTINYYLSIISYSYPKPHVE